jgi:hypothetical protein
MKPKEIQKRDPKDENLRVLQTEDGSYFVESTEGKILYNVVLNESEKSCTCSDFGNNAKKDSEYQCKHILAVLNCVSSGDVVDGRFLEKPSPKLDERWIIEIEGNQFVKFAGLLDLAHQKGISQIKVTPLQLPTAENGNFAICQGVVVSQSGETFQDLGDANPGNCSSKVVKHLLRLASTRAIARSLRTFTNIGMTCLDELGDLNDVLGSESHGNNGRGGKQADGRGKKTTKNKKEPGKPSEPKSNTSPTKATKSDSKGKKKSYPPMSEAQKRAIENLSRRKGVSETETQKLVLDTYGCQFEDLSSQDASDFIRTIQKKT